ncbi:hypothetical protein CBS101457_004222 [Exobasidium rhododendri]|nr:hypothetical protein CBS101457_004222 [Exobasidium rhododendri]
MNQRQSTSPKHQHPRQEPEAELSHHAQLYSPHLQRQTISYPYAYTHQHTILQQQQQQQQQQLQRHHQHSAPVQSGGMMPNTQLRKGRWSPSEDNRLLDSIQRHGPNKWKLVAKEVVTRSGDQCWKRWNDSLNPILNHTQWSPAEDEILETAVLETGRTWSKIANESLGHRSGLACKNRWDHIQRKQRRMHQSQRDVLQSQRDLLQLHHSNQNRSDQSYCSDYRSMEQGAGRTTPIEGSSLQSPHEKRRSFGSFDESSEWDHRAEYSPPKEIMFTPTRHAPASFWRPEERYSRIDYLSNTVPSNWSGMSFPGSMTGSNSDHSTYHGSIPPQLHQQQNNSMLESKSLTMNYTNYPSSSPYPATSLLGHSLQSNSSINSSYHSSNYSNVGSSTLLASQQYRHPLAPFPPSLNTYSNAKPQSLSYFSNQETSRYSGGPTSYLDSVLGDPSTISAPTASKDNYRGSVLGQESFGNADIYAPAPTTLQPIAYSQPHDNGSPSLSLRSSAAPYSGRSFYKTKQYDHSFMHRRGPSESITSRFNLTSFPSIARPVLQREDREEGEGEERQDQGLYRKHPGAGISTCGTVTGTVTSDHHGQEWSSKAADASLSVEGDDFIYNRMQQKPPFPANNPFAFSPDDAMEQHEAYHPGSRNSIGEEARLSTAFDHHTHPYETRVPAMDNEEDEDETTVFSASIHRDESIHPPLRPVKIEEVGFFDEFHQGPDLYSRRSEEQDCQVKDLALDSEGGEDDHLLPPPPAPHHYLHASTLSARNSHSIGSLLRQGDYVDHLELNDEKPATHYL